MNRRIAKHYGIPAVFPDDAPAGAGGGGGTAPPAGGAPAAPAAPAAGSTPGVTRNADGTLTVTEDYIASRAAREKDEGRRAGIRSITDPLNMSPEEIIQAVKTANDAKEAAKTEEQKRLDALAEKEAKTAAREAAAEAREREAARKSLLVGHGAVGDDLTDAVALLSTRVADDADEAAVTEAAGKLKEARPELFTGKATTTTAPSSTPAPPPAATTSGGSEFGADGAAEAARRFPKKETAGVT